ncbi:type II toxin-antitoxin system Phd/YefM family antitoxin [Rathayibacter sp. CAU 1779]
METVTHREMRNRSGEILRRVEAGESVQVSNNGRLAAVIVPPGRDVIDDLVAKGEARPARTGTETLLTARRAQASRTTRQIIEDSRAPW